jgi:very-short-patch-repair endonuclease
MKTDKHLHRNSVNYFSLPFNPELKQRARALRKAGNLSEVLFWNKVKRKQFFGLDFDRQKIIGNYIVDFYCTNCNVVVEIDGSSNDKSFDYDQRRYAYLCSLGLTVIRIPVEYIMNNIEEVMCTLVEHPVFKNYLLTTPSQNTLGHPSPGGE